MTSSGTSGQLGHGDKTDKLTPTLVDFFVDKNIFVREVSAGGAFQVAHTVALSGNKTGEEE